MDRMISALYQCWHHLKLDNIFRTVNYIYLQYQRLMFSAFCDAIVGLFVISNSLGDQTGLGPQNSRPSPCVKRTTPCEVLVQADFSM